MTDFSPRPDVSSAALPRVAPGALFGGRFRVVRAMAQGGCATVHLAYDEQRQEPCVLKVAEGRHAALLRHEAHSLARIDHPRVVAARGAGSDGSCEFLALDLIEGLTLEQLRKSRGGSLRVREALTLLSQIAEGLEALHSAGLVHGDIKGENVLVDPKRGAVLIDLGVGTAVHPGTPDSIAGTPSYLPPERATGAFVPASEMPRLDVYSLAVLAYELIFGVLPFTGETVQEMLLAHASEAPSAPPPLPGVHSCLTSALERALAKTPEDRPATPAQLVYELKRALPESRSSKVQLLVADDDDAWLALLCRGLTESFPGAEISQSRNGLQAIETALAERPDAAIVDAEMPRLDGGGLVRALRARWGPDLPIVVITGAPMSDPGKEARGGAQVTLVKPVSPRAVAMTLASMLDVPLAAV